MNDIIEYKTITGSIDKVRIIKFRAFECLDFMLELLRMLPEKIRIGNDEIKSDAVRYAIHNVMDTGINIPLTDEIKTVINTLQEFDIIKLVFHTVYFNSSTECREMLLNKLFSLLRDVNSGNPVQLKELIANPKDIIPILTAIIKYNYDGFFL